MVFWQQDIYSAAIASAAAARFGILGHAIGTVANFVERAVARESKAIIAISDDFLAVLDRWKVSQRTTVIPNWAPTAELPVRPRNNAWATKHGLVGRPVVLYSGTLGFKHNPAILVSIARAMKAAFPKGLVLVVSEGLGRDWLAGRKLEEGLTNLELLDYQSYDSFPDVLGSADVLLAILEPSAGQYSVPSKVLSYLCAARAIVAVMPNANAAASVLKSSGGGVVVRPGREHEAVDVILELLGDEPRRTQFARAARQYSETSFNISPIADRFEAILARAAV